MLKRWVLLKGMKQDARHWRDLPARLASALGDGAEVVPVDLPGSGARHRERSPWTVDGLVRAVRADVGPGPWGLLGLSLGGMVMLRWAAQHPDEVAAVVVGNTSARQVGGPHQRLHWRAWPRVVGAASSRDVAAREAVAVGLVSARAGEPVAKTWVDEHVRWQRELPFTRRALLGQLAAGARFRAPDRVSAPLTVLVGTGDRFVDPRCSLRLADRLGARLAVHPTAGHDLTLDAPDWLLAQVVQVARSAG